jgi:hypothetical protein
MKQEIQKGLYVEKIITNNGNYLKLSAVDGYCFYDKEQEYYDENNNLIAEENVEPEMRDYFVILYTPLMTNAKLNARFVSVEREVFMEVK